MHCARRFISREFARRFSCRAGAAPAHVTSFSGSSQRLLAGSAFSACFPAVWSRCSPWRDPAVARRMRAAPPCSCKERAAHCTCLQRRRRPRRARCPSAPHARFARGTTRAPAQRLRCEAAARRATAASCGSPCVFAHLARPARAARALSVLCRRQYALNHNSVSSSVGSYVSSSVSSSVSRCVRNATTCSSVILLLMY